MQKKALIDLGDSDDPVVSLNEDPDNCVVGKLRRWLECYGVKNTNK